MAPQSLTRPLASNVEGRGHESVHPSLQAGPQRTTVANSHLAFPAPQPRSVSPRPFTESGQDLILSEIKELGHTIRSDCSAQMKELSLRLLNDVRRDMQRLLQLQRTSFNGDAIVQNGVPGVREANLRATAFHDVDRPAGWGKIGNVAIRPDSGSRKPSTQSLARKKPCMVSTSNDDDPSRSDGTWNAGNVSKPDDSPPMLPWAVPRSEEHNVKALNGKHHAVRPILNFPNSGGTPTSGAVEGNGTHGESDAESVDTLEESLRGDLMPMDIQELEKNDGKSWGSEGQRQSTANGRTSRARISISREKARVEATRKHSVRSAWRSMTIAEFIKTPFFDNLVGGVILLNAAVIGFQTDYNAKNVTDEVPVVFFVFEQFFAAWFTFELSIRIYVYRCLFFKPMVEGWAWNYFDSFVVAAQLLELFFEVVARSASVDAGNFRVLRVLRILRLVRILRVVRVLHLISELRAIVSSIVGSFRSLIWVVVLMVLMMYIVAVFFTQSITDHLVELKNDSKTTLSSGEQDLSNYFGSLARGILSLWQAMSGGLDWDGIAGPLFDEISFVTGFAFAAFIAFALLALMNVVTGVFVQTALLSAREEEDAFMTQQIIALFHKADKDQSTTISMKEIEDSLEDPMTAKEWKSIGVQAEDARYLFKLLDLEDTGEVAFEEFMGGCLRLSGDAKAIDLLTVMQESRKLDEVIRQNFLQVNRSISDLQLTITNSREDVVHLLADCSCIADGMASNSGELANMSFMLGAEFSAVKTILQPLSMLEDIFSGDASPNGHNLV